MKYAYPDDELRPVSCIPLTRDNGNPSRTELNDPLGNYTLTLVDSLSTLAILASGSAPEKSRTAAFSKFQTGVRSLVRLYGDGSSGASGQGTRARGFDLDSKVQVFETVIRGVGGLLSAHLFATGELPIAGYNVRRLSTVDAAGRQQIRWSKTFSYDGQLLRLAVDLAERLLPAFSTSTGIPYPRVNLRYGIPFYANSPLSCNNPNFTIADSDLGKCPAESHELTETCSAASGSLVLEFSVLSRLTGDFRFEHLAKRAFWAIWDRRTPIGLVGSSIDAETGFWTSPYTGIGAGVDSFFEYAMKAYVLLSGSDWSVSRRHHSDPWFKKFGSPVLNRDDHDPESFLIAWRQAHEALKLHVYRGQGHMYPHYIQTDLFTGANRGHWIDALSAFYPGLLVLTGDVEEATENHLIFAALWHRYSGIPERWSTLTGTVESGLSWWLGRPEFIESTYHLYQATQDPFYIHVGEMALRDIRRRCWAECGLSGLQDVRTGEHNDRMESFFLGETAKYLYLLFDADHPLNHLDAPFVFSTEGHPLIIPRTVRHTDEADIRYLKRSDPLNFEEAAMCPTPRPINSLTASNVASRHDFFHAADFARLHMMPNVDGKGSLGIECAADHPSLPIMKLENPGLSPSDFAFYPWTLPLDLIPSNGTSSIREPTPTFDISFPSSASIFSNGLLQRVSSGVLVTGMGGLRLSMIQDVPGADPLEPRLNQFRIQTINNIPLGREEKIFLSRELLANNVNPTDPNFLQLRDEMMIDLAIDVPSSASSTSRSSTTSNQTQTPDSSFTVHSRTIPTDDSSSLVQSIMRLLAQQVPSIVPMPGEAGLGSHDRHYIPAILSTGPGYAPLPETQEFSSPDLTGKPRGTLLWDRIFVGDENCDAVLPASVPREHQVLVLRRGQCNFSEKLENIPSFAPSNTSLRLVIVVSFGSEGLDDSDERLLIRPHLERMQYTSTGIPRRNPIPMVMVGGGEKTFDALRDAHALGQKRRYSMMAQGVNIANLIVI
jgi:Glycosyl hydrolase family 47